MRDGNPLQAHIAAIGRRSAADHDRLAEVLAGRCWPGGEADRNEPAAREWVRRWRRASAHAVVLECTCAQGRRAICN